MSGFTNKDTIITFNLESWMAGVGLGPLPGVATTGSVTYNAMAGYTKTDIEHSSALNVDNLEIDGPQATPSITEDGIHAGLWNSAYITVFTVNYKDLTQGAVLLWSGTFGEVKLERDSFVAELRGLMDALQRTFGQLFTPLCPYNLGDLPFPAQGRGRCTKDLTTFTVTGTLTGVSADQQTLYDTARTEPGPAGGVAIISITNANPAVVTTATPLGLPDFATVTMSQIVGPVLLNAVTVIRNPSGNIFELTIDTSNTTDYPPYVGSGIVTPLGAESGYFDYGLFTVTDVLSLNFNLSMEVKAYTPGQWTLQLPFYYPLLGNETYTMVAGCNKTFGVCKVKFSNGDNFGGYSFVPGQDKIIQVAQPQSGQAAPNKLGK